MKYGSITTGIIADGLVFNIDAANRASTIPSSATTKAFNTLDTSISGSFVNDTIYDSSTIPPSYAFDGTADYIEITNLNVLNGLSTCTFSCWGKKTASNKDLVVGAGTAETNSIYILWYLNGYVYFGTRATGATGFNINKNFAGDINNFHNFVGVYDQGIASLYINGILETGPTSGGPSALGSNIDETLKIGRLGNVTSYDTTGNIGPVHIYNRALSANEVLHNYNALKGRFGL